MNPQKYGTPKEHLKYTLHPQKNLRQFVLSRLDYLLGFLHQTAEEIYPDFIENLHRRVRGMVNLAHFDDARLEISVLLTRYPYLQEHASLTRLLLNFYIQIVGITEPQFWADDPILVEYRIFSHSVFRFEYATLQALIDTIGREEALNLFRAYRDRFNIDHDEDFPRIEKLEDLRGGLIRLAESGALGQVRVISEIEDGRFVHRCENCEKVAMIEDLNVDDLELLETVLCYGDYQVTILYNVNFVLTRKQTIAGGAATCDSVYHDRRLTGTIQHPDADFWASLDEQLRGAS